MPPVVKQAAEPAKIRHPGLRDPVGSRGRSWLGAAWLGGAVLGIGSVGLVALAGGFVFFVSTIDTVETFPSRRADGIVALTGGADRVSDALDLLGQGRARRLLITGVNPSTDREELARHQPAARAFVDCCVDLGYRAMNTVGNARETAEWVQSHDVKSLIVVTSNYHMPRALAEIAAELPHVELHPYPVISDRARAVPWWTDAKRTRLLAWEYLKYLAVRARLILIGRPA